MAKRGTEEYRAAARVRAKAWHWANKDKANAASRARYLAKREEHYRKIRDRITSSPERHRAYKDYMVNYAQVHSAEAVARTAAWRKANPDKVKLANAKRKALKLGTAVGDIDFNTILARGMVCGICDYRIEGRYQYDHIIPLASGGPHTQENLQLSHPICNSRKKANRNYTIPSVLKKTPKGLV